jgi:hypothetical protein
MCPRCIPVLLPALGARRLQRDAGDPGGATPNQDALAEPAADAERSGGSAQHVELVSPRLPLVAAGAPGWEYLRETRVDLDGAGIAERVVLIADVTLLDGQPLWEDSHAWQLYVECASGERTYVFARVVQHAELRVAISEPPAGMLPRLVLWEHTPHGISVYQVEYRAGEAVLADAYRVDLSTRYRMVRP